jgi:hypothetical protein
MVKDAKPRRLEKALLETADDMRRVGVINDATHQKITLRHLGDKEEEQAGERLETSLLEGLSTDESKLTRKDFAEIRAEALAQAQARKKRE